MPENKTEVIGKVKLDLTHYPGEDFYCDGEVEDEILEITRNYSAVEYRRIIEERESWPVLYHLSPLRGNIVEWLPITKDMKVLEVGSGCGAITGTLARKAGQVTCVELSGKRSRINAYRHMDADNVTIHVGNFQEIEPDLPCDYDYICLIGVFEYAQAYIQSGKPYESFLNIIKKHRKPEGHIAIAIENKFGLKYWAGCQEDHLGTYFSGLENYPDGGVVRTFTRDGLFQTAEKCGFTQMQMYYPYPDYKFMTTVYSDRRLPKKGELSNNLRNFDRERVLLFDEKQVFDEIIAEKEFPLFSNSYLLVVGGAPDVIYAKFSNDRAPKWAIRTSMAACAPDCIQVEKIPDTAAAYEHMEHTRRAYALLAKRYEGTKIEINRCSEKDGNAKNGLVFEYCKGLTLEAMLDMCLDRADVEGFKALVAEYMEWLRYGEVCDGEEAVSNIDFIFPNILVEGDKWHVIDYEWTFEKYVPAKEIAFRAFYDYILGGARRKACRELLFQEILGLSEEEITAAVQKEQEFQRLISGDHVSVDAMRELIGNRAYELDGMLSHCHYADERLVAQLYFDYGEGFSEAHSVKLRDCFFAQKDLRIAYDIPKDAVRVRIAPCSYMCTVSIRSIMVNDSLYVGEDMETNGVWHSCGSLVFASEDPNIAIHVSGGGRLHADMEVMELPEVLAKKLAQDASEQNIMDKTKHFIKQRLKGKN